ncbi:hypothetical protein QU24_04495 [Pantoea rodasii]|uniref:Uncharacterized protein n=2 Tax=Pantoea rodasii TaxID=1076549 RepID=A0A0B1RCA6_9GAMM|nr:hypothetical protein QU24_04495 [Pantoea rodasii]
MRQHLNMQGAPDHHLYKGIAGLLSLPDEIHNILNQHFPHRRWTHWLEKVNACFSKINLNAQWASAIDTVDDRALTELEMISTVLEAKGQIALIDQDEMDVFREKINALKSDVISAELSSGIKQSILHYLNKILAAIESYQITGVEPIMEAMESAIGRAALNEDYRDALRETGVGKKLGEIISLVANAVTIAQGIPFVATPLLTLLGSQ